MKGKENETSLLNQIKAGTFHPVVYCGFISLWKSIQKIIEKSALLVNKIWSLCGFRNLPTDSSITV